MAQIDIQPMHPSEIKQAAKVLSQALVCNPIQVAVYHGHGYCEQQRIKAGFAEILRHQPGQAFLAKQDQQIIGVYRRKLCTGSAATVHQNQILQSSNESLLTSVRAREQYWLACWANHDPVRQHSHLGPIGILPQYQHHGIGTALLQHYCHALDYQKLSAYLEADKWQNVGFYERFGFRVIDQAEILGIQSYFMWREANS